MGISQSIESIKSTADRFIENKVFYPPPPGTNTINNTVKFARTSTGKFKIPFYLIQPTLPASKNYIVFSHGNASDIYQMYNFCENLANMAKCNVIIYDYIGYGKLYHHHPSEERCYISHEAVINYLIRSGINASNIYLVGQSLGTGIVVDYITKHRWTTPVLLISPYKSICSIVTDLSSMIQYIDKFNTINKISATICPIKIVHGVDDTLIKITHAYELYKNLPSKYRLTPVWYSDTGHNDILEQLTPNVFDYIKK